MLSAEQKSSQKSSHSSSQSSESKSVSITSDGTNTITKTTIIRNGVKEVITEIVGKDGKKTTTKEGGDNKDDDEQCEADKSGPWLGVRVKEISDAMRGQLKLEKDEGVEVDLVAKDSPATTSDIRVGDIILSLAGTSIASPQELSDELNRHQPEETVKLVYLRAGERKEVDVILKERPKKDGEKAEGSDDDGAKQDKAFDDILNNPNVSEEFKKKVRDMKNKMKDFQKKAGVDHINVMIKGKGFDEILNNPDVPESFKKAVRDMLKKVRDGGN
jgi:membrane-associated protease RseP (regulator of RpoE activity)